MAKRIRASLCLRAAPGISGADNGLKPTEVPPRRNATHRSGTGTRLAENKSASSKPEPDQQDTVDESNFCPNEPSPGRGALRGSMQFVAGASVNGSRMLSWPARGGRTNANDDSGGFDLDRSSELRPARKLM